MHGDLLTFIVGGTFALCGMSLILFGVYKIKPEIFKLNFEVGKKLLTMNIEISGHGRKTSGDKDGSITGSHRPRNSGGSIPE